MKKMIWALLIGGTLAACAGEVSPKAERKATPATVTGGATSAVQQVNADMAAKLKKPITAEFQEANFRDATTYLQEANGINIIVVQEPAATVTLKVKDLPLSEVIRYLAALTGLEAAIEDNAVVFRPPTAEKKNTAHSGVRSAAGTTDAALAAKLKKPVTMSFKDCPLPQVLDALHKAFDLNLVLTFASSEPITITVKDMPLEEFVRYLGEQTGFDCAPEGNAVVFRPKPAAPAQAGTGGDNYKMETSVEGTTTPHQYTVAIKIHHSPDGKKWDVLSAPRITVRAGQEGKIEIKDDKTSNGVECTVLVNEAAGGVVEMNVSCKVREAGRAPWQSELKTRIKLP